MTITNEQNLAIKELKDIEGYEYVYEKLTAIGISSSAEIHFTFDVVIDPTTFKPRNRLIAIGTTNEKDRFVLDLYDARKLCRELRDYIG